VSSDHKNYFSEMLIMRHEWISKRWAVTGDLSRVAVLRFRLRVILPPTRKVTVLRPVGAGLVLAVRATACGQRLRYSIQQPCLRQPAVTRARRTARHINLYKTPTIHPCLNRSIPRFSAVDMRCF